MEGGITRFSSGIAGVAVVLFALMGTIGVGYLLNGSTGLQTVNDYDYVTDVSGLYDYTPVPAYAAYSPATNNYQFSDSLATLGTYTSGIDYTPAGAANLNPIITPDSGSQSVSGSFSPYTTPNTGGRAYLGAAFASTNTYPLDAGWRGTVSDYLTTAVTSPFDTLTLETSVHDLSGLTTIAIPLQQFGVIAPGTYSDYGQAYQAATLNKASAAYVNGILTVFPAGTYSYDMGGNTYTNTYAVGSISDLIVRPNGTVEYTYTLNENVDYVTAQTTTLNIYSVAFSDGNTGNFSVSPRIFTFDYSGTHFGNVGYLDANAGVSLSSSTPVFWSNGTDLGSVTWAFKKPATASSIRVAQLTAGGQTMNEFVVSWSGAMWQMSYLAPGGTQTTVDLGSGWQAVYVRAFYTGELQAGPVDGFFNFTSYTLGPATTYATSYTGNVPIDHCQISGSTTMKFACIGTTARTGVVPGAMFDATFTASTWFPGLASVRVSFDSAAYVGSAVRVGSWTMAVDSGTFIGDLQDVDGITFRADLTQPWAVTWNPGSTSVSLTFTPYQQAGTQTITILADDDSRTVNLDGQWAIDTDLYSVGTHIEEVYEWNFGNWGLDKEQFIVCAMGLTALLAIAFKLARVPFHALDFVVIFLGNLILWVIM